MNYQPVQQETTKRSVHDWGNEHEPRVFKTTWSGGHLRWGKWVEVEWPCECDTLPLHAWNRKSATATYHYNYVSCDWCQWSCVCAHVVAIVPMSCTSCACAIICCALTKSKSERSKKSQRWIMKSRCLKLIITSGKFWFSKYQAPATTQYPKISFKVFQARSNPMIFQTDSLCLGLNLAQIG